MFESNSFVLRCKDELAGTDQIVFSVNFRQTLSFNHEGESEVGESHGFKIMGLEDAFDIEL